MTASFILMVFIWFGIFYVLFLSVLDGREHCEDNWQRNRTFSRDWVEASLKRKGPFLIEYSPAER